MYGEYDILSVDPSEPAVREELAGFLKHFDLKFDERVEYTIVVRDRRGAIIGTGSFAGDVLMTIAVDPSQQGEGLTAAIVNSLIQEQARRGIMHRLIFTRPGSAKFFASLGFREIARAEPYAVLLEGGLHGLDRYLERTRQAISHLPPSRAAVVVNCNPFTRGHLGLIETAAARAAGVVVFVVREDRSLFPFRDRFDLVQRGTSHLANVAVVDTDRYMVSAATFPTYFTREEHLANAQAHLDVALFAQRIAPALDIRMRFVGEEPYCPVTEAYNRAMREILPRWGIEFEMIPRFTTPDGRIISASTVRECIRKNDWDALRSLVPDVTWEYLRAPEQAALLEKIRKSTSRH